MKNYTVIGLAVGIVLAFSIILAGLSGFLWTVIFGAVGLAVGAHLDGHYDLGSFISGNRRNGRG